MRFALSTLAAVLIGPAAFAAPSVGFADADVTPEVGNKPVYMAGFGQDRRATKIHDPIMVRAVVLKGDKLKVALVSVDVVGLFLPFVEHIRRELPGFDY